MKLRRQIPILSSFRISLNLLLVLSAQKVCAQLLPADDFFNTGAQLYISNNIPAALTNVEQGLQIYPNDEKLQKLEKLLKQQQQQNQQQQNQQNQQSKNDQNSQQQKNSQSQQNQQNQKQNDDKQNSQDKEDQQKQQPQNSSKQNQAEKQNGDKNGETNSAPQNVKVGQMTPEDAKRLLDQQKDGEQVLQFAPKGKPRDATKPIKDW